MPGSSLEAMFSGRHMILQENGQVMVDRDPKAFKWLIYYLEYKDRMPMIENKFDREMFELELDFWCIEPLTFSVVPLSIYENKLQDLLDQDPKQVTAEALQTFRKIGPLDLRQFIFENQIEIDESLRIDTQACLSG